MLENYILNQFNIKYFLIIHCVKEKAYELKTLIGPVFVVALAVVLYASGSCCPRASFQEPALETLVLNNVIRSHAARQVFVDHLDTELAFDRKLVLDLGLLPNARIFGFPAPALPAEFTRRHHAGITAMNESRLVNVLALVLACVARFPFTLAHTEHGRRAVLAQLAGNVSVMWNTFQTVN